MGNWREDGRVRIVFVCERVLLELFQGPAQCILLKLNNPKLPDDARVVQVNHDWSRRAFGAVVWSASFEPVKPGSLIPVFDEDYPMAEYTAKYVVGDRIVDQCPLDLAILQHRGGSAVRNAAIQAGLIKPGGSEPAMEFVTPPLTAEQESSREWFQREMSRTD